MGEYKNVPQEINDVVSDNIKKLAQLFPSAVKDGQLDIDALKEELGTFEEVGKEKYEFTWSGKQNAKKIAQQDVFGKTLKFCPEKSKNADTTENIYIEGDNLEALKLLRQNYYNSIKMIYIDPPYNTGNDFVYNDDYSMSQEESDIAEGVVDELGERYTKNQKSTNKFHAKWLNEMYPRLKLAKDLLTDDGVIFISIDDNEVENLKKIACEIFGESNFIGQWNWYKSATPPNLSIKIKKNIEYILCFEKNKNSLKYKGIQKTSASSNGLLNQTNSIGVLRFPKNVVDTGLADGVYKAGKYGTASYDIELLEDAVVESGIFISEVVLKSKFKWGQENLLSEISKGTKISIRTNTFSPSYEKSEYDPEVPPNLIDKSVYVDTTEQAGKLLNALMEEKVFDYPKPVELIQYLSNFVCLSDDIILDFFSGSATTAHAVMQLNAEDGGNRKFIMVQLEEKTDEKSEAHKAGYNTICEIGEERIRRAGDKIKAENPDANIDIGFKVFEITNTNIKWNELELKDEQIDFDSLSDTPDQIDFKQGTKDIDVVYEIMLRQKNIPLSSKIEVLDEIGSRTYLYADSYLVCLETQVTNDMIDKLASLDPTPFKYIFRDSAFKDDIDLKTNAFRRLKAMVKKHAGATKKAYTVEFI